jgi:hypothetical protein
VIADSETSADELNPCASLIEFVAHGAAEPKTLRDPHAQRRTFP